jgi:hypothetical protein
MTKQWCALTLFFGFAVAVGHAAEERRGFRFQPSSSVEAELKDFGDVGTWSLAFGTEGHPGTSLPFAIPTAGGFRYQSPVGASLELSRVFWPNWELGLRLSWVSVELRSGRDQSGTTVFDSVLWRQLPRVEAIGRYRSSPRESSFEAEAFAGWARSAFRVESTDPAISKISASASSIVLGATVGWIWQWSEALSLRAHAGLGFTGLKEQSYTAASLPTISQNGSYLAPILRTQLRYQF